MVLFEHKCQWILLVVTLFCCGLESRVNGDEELAMNYTSVIDSVRMLVTHPYLDTTLVMTGGRGVEYVSIASFAINGPLVDLILSHYNLCLLGYRVNQEDGDRVVFLFLDTDPNDLDEADYDRQEKLSFGGSYQELMKTANKTRQQVLVNAQTLQAYVQDLGNALDEATEQKQAEALLGLAIIVAEGSRFTEIHDSVQKALWTDQTWHATCHHVNLMHSWIPVSKFIAGNTQDLTASSILFLPKLGQEVTLGEALDMTAVILRCFHTPLQSRITNDIPDPCKPLIAVDSSFSDGPNNVYFFNGPNFVNVKYTDRFENDRIVEGVKSIYLDWPFLQGTDFVNGIEAGFSIPGTTIAVIFRGGICATIDFHGKSIIRGPSAIADVWKSFNQSGFGDGIDAAYHSIFPNEIYVFRRQYYIRVYYELGHTNDEVRSGPWALYTIWNSLKRTRFVDGFEAAFSRPDVPDACVYESDEYMVIDYAPRRDSDSVITNTTKIRNGWKSLRKTAFDI